MILVANLFVSLYNTVCITIQYIDKGIALKIFMGIILAFVIGAVTRMAGIPVPAPPAIMGALLVVAMTVGFNVMNYYMVRQTEPAVKRAES